MICLFDYSLFARNHSVICQIAISLSRFCRKYIEHESLRSAYVSKLKLALRLVDDAFKLSFDLLRTFFFIRHSEKNRQRVCRY